MNSLRTMATIPESTGFVGNHQWGPSSPDSHYLSFDNDAKFSESSSSFYHRFHQSGHPTTDSYYGGESIMSGLNGEWCKNVFNESVPSTPANYSNMTSSSLQSSSQIFSIAMDITSDTHHLATSSTSEYSSPPHSLVDSSESHFTPPPGNGKGHHDGLDDFDSQTNPGYQSRRIKKSRLIELDCVGVNHNLNCGTINCKRRKSHREIEKKRRDLMNSYISQLSSLVPSCRLFLNRNNRKLDKLTVLQMTVQHLKIVEMQSGSGATYCSTFIENYS